MTQARVYLAGPDVFDPDAEEVFARLSALARQHGLDAIVPLEDLNTLAKMTRTQKAQHIFASNVARLDAADGMVANLRDFRGTEPDSGTVFEVGYAVACGIPVVGYGVHPDEYAVKASSQLSTYRDQAGALREQGTDIEVEDFGQRMNLMLACAVEIVADADAALALVASRIRG